MREKPNLQNQKYKKWEEYRLKKKEARFKRT